MVFKSCPRVCWDNKTQLTTVSIYTQPQQGSSERLNQIPQTHLLDVSLTHTHEFGQVGVVWPLPWVIPGSDGCMNTDLAKGFNSVSQDVMCSFSPLLLDSWRRMVRKMMVRFCIWLYAITEHFCKAHIMFFLLNLTPSLVNCLVSLLVVVV